MRLLPLLTFALLLSACAASPTAARTLEAPQATPQMIVLATRAPEMTATPTVGYQATADAASTTAAKANLIIAEYTAEHERAVEAEAARTQEAFVVWATAQPASQTQDAENRAADANSMAIRATATREAQVFAERMPTIVAAMTQAQFTEVREVTQIGLTWTAGAGVFLLGLALLLAVWRVVPQPEPQPVDENMMDEQPEHGPLVVQQTTQSGGYVSAMLIEIPEMYATRKQLEIVANGIRDGKRLSHAEFTPRMICFSEGQFTAFQYFLVEKTPYAEWVDVSNIRSGISLTPAGEQFFAKLQTANPFPTPEDFTPIGDFQPMADR